MALPAIGISKAIKRRLREAHQQEVVFWKAVVLAATKVVRQTRLDYQKATRREAGKRRRTRSETRSESRDRKERTPSPKRQRDLKEDCRRRRGELVEESPPRREDKKSEQEAEATPTKEWATGSGRGKVTIEALRRHEDKIVPVILSGIEGIDPMDLFRSVGTMLGKLSLDYEIFKEMKLQHKK